MLPDSIIKRAENRIEQGMDILEAVKMAIQEENKMIESLIGNAPFLNSKGKAISTKMSKMMYENNKK